MKWFPVIFAAIAAFASIDCASIDAIFAADNISTVRRQAAPFPRIVDSSKNVEGKVAAYEVLRGDFHMHTIHSDGTLSPAQRVLEAWGCGYDVIAITDHFNFDAYEEALPHANALGMILLRGMETGIVDKEHMVALDFSKDYCPRHEHKWAEQEGQQTVYYQEQLQRLADAGAYVLYAHPHVGLRPQVLWAIDKGIIKGIEVKNDSIGQNGNTVQSNGCWWYPDAFDWALEHHLSVFADTDSHSPRSGIDQATTLLLVKERSVAGVREALDAGRTIAQFNGILCAREQLLALLIDNLVDIELQGDAENGWRLCIENRGPVMLNATIEKIVPEEISIMPFERTVMPLSDKPESLTVKWKNLWIRPSDNLTTAHSFVVNP